MWHVPFFQAKRRGILFLGLYYFLRTRLNENTNDLTRQYFTKCSSFETITGDDEAIMNKPAYRLRKTLNFKIP